MPCIKVKEIVTKEKKTRNKKHSIVAQVTPDGIIGSLMLEQRPLIAHLPIHSNDIDNDLFATTPVSPKISQMPIPFDADEAEQLVQISQPSIISIPTQTVTHNLIPLQYSEKLMSRFQDSNREHTLPTSTDIACFWDCHPFRGNPFVIPTIFDEGFWNVYGNFCSPECAAAYLFQEHLDLHVRWERFALLNQLYPLTDSYQKIHLAPSRMTLRQFGGTLDITQFRAMISDNHIRIDVITPPMISIIQVMDTKPIDFYDGSMKNTLIPWKMNRLDRPGAQGLRLRRMKPVAEQESTLEYCMGIKTITNNNK